MNAANSLDTKSKPMADHRIPEPSMEEILASIRRIIADDESLPGRKEATAQPPEPEPVRPSEHNDHATDAHGDRVELLASPEPMLSVGELVSEDVLETDAPTHHADVPADHGDAFVARDHVSSHTTPDPSPVAPLAPRTTRPVVLIHEKPAGAPSRVDHPVREPYISEDTATPQPVMEARVDADHVEPELLGLPSDALFSAATHQSVAAAFQTLAATRFADNSEELLDIAREMIKPLLKSWIDNNVPAMVERMVRAEIERVARGGR